METKQTKELLRGSLELKVTWARLLIVCLAAIPVVVFWGLTWNRPMELYWMATAVILGIMVVPLLVFCIVRTAVIFHKPEAYIFCRGKLSQPHGGALRNTIFYTVVLEYPETGEKFFVDTHAIFYTHGSLLPSLDNYTNATVTIAYNQETEMVVVIG